MSKHEVAERQPRLVEFVHAQMIAWNRWRENRKKLADCF
jgi:hypothetical protein